MNPRTIASIGPNGMKNTIPNINDNIARTFACVLFCFEITFAFGMKNSNRLLFIYLMETILYHETPYVQLCHISVDNSQVLS